MEAATGSPNLVPEGSINSMWFAWVLGLVLVFALQLTIAALGVAVVSSTASFRSGSSDLDTQTSNLSSAVIVGGAAVGTLLGVDTTLFAACFAAVKLLPSASVESGAVLGLGIWGSYLLLCTWTSFSAANTVLSAASKLVFGGLGRLIRALSDNFGDSNTSLISNKTSEDSARMSQVLEQLSSIHQTIHEISSSTDFAILGSVTSEFWDWLSDRREKKLKPFQLQNIDPTTIKQDIQSFLDDKSFDIADEDIPAVRTILEDITLGLQEHVDEVEFNSSTKSANLIKAVRTKDVDTLLSTVDQLSTEQSFQESSFLDSFSNIDFESVIESLFSRVDFSDWDIESVWQALLSLMPISNGSEKSYGNPSLPNIIGLDLKRYLSELYPWQLNPDHLTATIPDILCDADADPIRVFELLSDINKAYIENTLKRHPANLSSTRVRDLSLHINSICSKTLEIVKTEGIRLAIAEFERTLVEQVQIHPEPETRSEVCETIANNLLDEVETIYPSPLVESILQVICERSPSQWPDTLTADTTLDLNDCNDNVLNELASLVITRAGQRLSEHRDRRKKIDSAGKIIDRKLESYLRYTSLDKLDSSRIEDKLDRLMTAVSLPKSERGKLKIDLSNLEAILERRKSLNPSHRQQILSSLETYFDKFQPVSHLRNGSEPVLIEISSELRDIIVTHLERSEFDKEQLQQDLLQWCQSPASGQQILARRLGQIDWMSLISDVASHVPSDLSSIRATVGAAYSVFRNYLKAPRRWVERTKLTSPDLKTHLKTYLQFTPKSDFNPQTIGHHLEMLYEREGSSVTEEFSMQLESDSFSLATILSLLERRGDLSISEARQIAHQVSKTFTELKERSDTILQHGRTYSHAIKNRLQSFISSDSQPFSSSHPSSNYTSSAKHSSNLETLIQAAINWTQDGISAVYDELNQLTSAESLEQINNQLQTISDAALSLASQVPLNVSTDFMDPLRSHLHDSGKRIAENIGQLQHQVEARLDAAKELAIEQAETARKSAAVAAWWLFAIASTSAIAAASAGVLAVTGLPVPFTSITL